MLKVERSSHVKMQLSALETYVLSLRQRYDALATSRQHRERSLYLSTQILTSLFKECAGSRSELLLSDLKTKCDETNELLERELMYRETLEHMLENTRKDILAKAGPTQPMMRTLVKERIKSKTEVGQLVLTAHEVEKLKSEVKQLQRSFSTQHSKHSFDIHGLFERYTMQKEFVLLCEEQQKQFTLRDSITELDIEERKTMTLLREAKSAEEMKRKADMLNEQAQKQKEALGQLSQVARLTDADDIIKYYQFLIESSHTLESTRLSLEDRISSLKESFDLATLDFKRASDVGTTTIPSFSHIDALEEQVRTAEKGEEIRLEKVNWFQKEYGRVQDMIAGLLHQVSGLPKITENIDVPALLPTLESSLLKLLIDLDLATHRTEATEASEIS